MILSKNIDLVTTIIQKCFKSSSNFCGPHRKYELQLEIQIVGMVTGKSFSEVLILASTNSQYDKRLSTELPIQYMKIPSLEHGENMRRT